MPADYHIHTAYCGHARGSIGQYVESAISLGLREIGFSDHLGRYYLTPTQRRRYLDWGMDEKKLKRYFSDLLKAKESYQDRIVISVGLEVDYVEGCERLLEPIIGRFTFDYLLCSIHCLPRFSWKHLSNYLSYADTSAIYTEYFRVVRSAIGCGLFHILAHPDLIWRTIGWPTCDASFIFREIADMTAAAKTTNHAIEINSNGFRWSRENRLAYGDPFFTLLDQCGKLGTPISLGSDAHEPQSVGQLFPELRTALRQRGITGVTCFTAGIPRNEPLI
jgi:histidinol-phosphatase (PHP family)